MYYVLLVPLTTRDLGVRGTLVVVGGERRIEVAIAADKTLGMELWGLEVTNSLYYGLRQVLAY